MRINCGSPKITLSRFTAASAPHRILGGGIGDEDDRDRPGSLRRLAAMRPAMALHDRFHRNRLLRQPLGDGGGCAGLIDRKQANVVAALVALHRRLLADGELRRRPAEWCGAKAARNVGDVGDHRGRGRHAAGARPDQSDRRNGFGVHRDRIGYAHHLGDRGILRNHRRVHALLDALLGAHRDAEQFYAIAELVGGVEIGRRDGGDAFDVDRLRIDARAEGQARQDRELLRGVVTFDVKRRIGLRIAQPLRLLEAFGEGQLLLRHTREDVIAGAVEDAVDARDRIAGESFAQCFHDRDGAADRGLEIERDAALLGKLRKRYAVMREQRLVGGDDRFPGLESSGDGCARRIAVAADQLDKHIDTGIDSRASPDQIPNEISSG